MDTPIFILYDDVVEKILEHVSSGDIISLSHVNHLLRDLTSKERLRLSELIPGLEYELDFFIQHNDKTKTISVELDRVRGIQESNNWIIHSRLNENDLNRLSTDDHYYSICTTLLEKLRERLGQSIQYEYKCKPERVRAAASISFQENTEEKLKVFVDIVYSFIRETISPFESLFKLYSFSKREINGVKKVRFQIAVKNKENFIGKHFVQEEISEETIRKYLNFQDSEIYRRIR